MAKQRMWTITVTRIGAVPPEVIERVEFQASTPLEAERKLSDVWNAGPCMQPGRFRAKLRDPSGKIKMTID